jgi:hypothetical protein
MCLIGFVVEYLSIWKVYSVWGVGDFLTAVVANITDFVAVCSGEWGRRFVRYVDTYLPIYAASQPGRP